MRPNTMRWISGACCAGLVTLLLTGFVRAQVAPPDPQSQCSGPPFLQKVPAPSPRSIAVDPAGNIYYADVVSMTPVAIDRTVTVWLYEWRLLGADTSGCVNVLGAPGPVEFDEPATEIRSRSPADLAIGRNGELVIADHTRHQLCGRGFIPGATGFSCIDHALDAGISGGVTTDAAGNIWVAQRGGIKEYTEDGTLLWRFDLIGDGGLPLASQILLHGIAIGVDGAIYVVDTASNCIRRVTTDGGVSTFAGSGTPGYRDGAGPDAQFNQPYGMAVDAAGTLYVADTGNDHIRQVSTDGTVSTFKWASGEIVPKKLPLNGGEKWTQPAYVAIGPTGDVYVTSAQPIGIVRLANGS